MRSRLSNDRTGRRLVLDLDVDRITRGSVYGLGVLILIALILSTAKARNAPASVIGFLSYFDPSFEGTFNTWYGAGVLALASVAAWLAARESGADNLHKGFLGLAALMAFLVARRGNCAS